MTRYTGFRVLIVDDNENNLYSLRALIGKHMDVEVLQAASGQAAIDTALKNPRIDLVILDVQMPEKNGFQVLMELKMDTFPLVVFVTAYDKYAIKGFDVHAVD